MYARVKLYSNKSGEIYRFLNSFIDNKKDTQSKNIVFSNMYHDSLESEVVYHNPVDIADIIGVFIDNSYKYKISIWISLDKDFFLKITDNNANSVIKYLYERYPY